MVSLWIIPFAVIGLLISGYIYYKKSRNENLACIIGKDCNKVVWSKYRNLFFGIPNELGGIGYYLLVIMLVVLLQRGVEMVLGVPLVFVLLIISGFAALFSLVLTFIQLGMLREWCEYCLASALLNILIFIFELVAA